MVITDINGTKIRVENEDHSKLIQYAAFELGYCFGKSGCEIQSTHFLDIYFTNDYLIGLEPGGVFHRNKQKEIFFYNGEFHDKPQDKSEPLALLDEAEVKKWLAAASKLIGLGYIFHNGEWLSKEEIEKQERLEAAYDLYCEWNINKESRFCFNIWKEEAEFTGRWLRVVDKTGYRKGEL